MKIKVLLSVFVLLFVICLNACGTQPVTTVVEISDTSLPTTTFVLTGTPVINVAVTATKITVPTGTPTGIPVKIGNFTGTDPKVSFDEILWEITNFVITVPFKDNKTCTLGPFYVKDLNSDGSFSYSVYVWGNSVQPDISITGILNGNSASGSYSLDICQGNSYADKVIPYTGTWSATLKGP